MKIQIKTVAELGEVLRATRKANHIRLDDLAGMAGVGPVFVGDVEYGKDTVQMGCVLQVLRELGLNLSVEMPDAAAPQLEKIRQQGGLIRPSKRKSQSSVSE